MTWVVVIYSGIINVIVIVNQCNYDVLINCNRYCVMGESIQNYFKVFSFLLIWDENLGPIRLTDSKTPLDTSLYKQTHFTLTFG